MADFALHHGDCLEVLRTLPDTSVDCVISDPPYGLDFMGKAWDHGVPGAPYWSAVLRVVKPGGYLLAMGGTRTYHRLACAVEDAGFQIRDCLMWLYGSGFPKGKGCLKPAWEPILLARKPGPRVLPLGVEECRVSTEGEEISQTRRGGFVNSYAASETNWGAGDLYTPSPAGRYPANVAHDGSEEVLEAFAAFGERKTSKPGTTAKVPKFSGEVYNPSTTPQIEWGYGDTGTAARFFYCAKASKRERGEGNLHPTVKPIALMRWLVRLVCPTGGTVLDPFTGSGTTGVACVQEGRAFIGIEMDAGYIDIASKRMAEAGILPSVESTLFDSLEASCTNSTTPTSNK